MLKKLLHIIILICCVKQAQAQNWESVPCFNANSQINVMSFDSLHNEINLHCNSIHVICNKPFKGVIAYNGIYFHDLDIGFQTHDGNLNAGRIAYTSITYSNKTLYGGMFESAGSNTLFTPCMALWDGSVWDTFPKRAFNYYPNKNTLIASFLKDNNQLWLAGVFDTIGGLPAQNLCTFNGSNFTPINIPAMTNVGIGKMVRYKDGIYMTGLFYDTPFSNNTRIIKYNDNATWSNVGNGVQGFGATIMDMLVYKDTLYIAGAFSKGDGNVGNYIMKWDGTQLYDAGFGNFYDWGAIKKLIIFKDRLYVFGNYSHTANKKTFGLSYYQNGKWIVGNDSIPYGIIGAEVLNNELYIAGGFPSINGDSQLRYFAKLRCPDFDNCNNGIEAPDNELLIFPNPANTEINIQTTNYFNTPSTISVYTDIGQLLFKNDITAANFKISCDSWAKGIYLIKLQNQHGQKIFKLVKE